MRKNKLAFALRPSAARSGELVRLSAVVLGLAGLVVALTSCGAPASRPAEGALAKIVERSFEKGEETFNHDEWERIIAVANRRGMLDYPALQKSRPRIDRYLQRVADVKLGKLKKDELMALLINAYNVFTITSIIDNPHVSSIKEIDGVWSEAAHPVGGYKLTLDEIEHNILRPFYRDPRIHFAVNCASVSCAPLPFWAFNGRQIEAQLEDLTRKFLSDSKNVRVEDDVLYVSPYFDWYGDDFTHEDWEPRAETTALFVAEYATRDIADFIRAKDGRPKMEFLDYDWSLNALKPPDPKLAPVAQPEE